MVIELVPEDYFRRLDFNSVFHRRAPIEVDLGCGDGSFLVARGAQNPQNNFLGLERLFGRVRTACRKIDRAHLENVRILRIESSYAVAHLFPPDSIAAFYLLFPDPWPKRRQQRRRLVTSEFLDALQRALVRDGLFVLATDDLDYFDQIRRLAQSHHFAALAPNEFDLPPTTFEKHFREDGLPIHRLVLRKASPVK